MALVRRSPRQPTGTEPPAELSTRRLDKGVARYYRLYELLSAALEDGTLPPQRAMPSEPELCLRHRLSRTTVRRALDRLQREGRIIRRRGSGTYAAPQRTTPRFCLELDALPAALGTLQARTTATTFFARAAVPAALAALAPGIGARTYRLERLRCIQGEPLALTVTWLGEPFGPRSPRHIQRQTSIVTLLAAPTAAVRCSIGTIAADADAAGALEVPLGSPVLRVRAVLSDAAGNPRAVLESLCRSDRLRLKLTERARC